MGKRSRPVCTVVQQEEVESITASSYVCTMVHHGYFFFFFFFFFLIMEEKKELFGSLAEKIVPIEGWTERNGKREKSSGRRRYHMIDDIKIYGSYAETRRKRREIRTHDQRPAREKIARSTLGWRAVERGKGQRGERVERVCARIFCLPREAEKSVEMEDSRIRAFEATSLWL
ncbi:hypothetical protein ANN_14847 [Periplaneta americana]|uniref:Uncharacterized protein n=1 Tax=Periplaneta americana TaxID=6978 RepID=A0ABQ8SY11_PERAM|nr:hypothetical protein ANN_14847 [Periplaneta americana]